MHFLVFGATGACGTDYCELALQEGHSVTVFVRNKSKLSEYILQSNVTVIEGTLDDESCLEEASRCGADVFVSFAGPSFGGTGTPLTDGYTKFLPMLLSQGIHRILILCTPSYRCEQDTPSLIWEMGKWTMRLFSASQYWEMTGIGSLIACLPLNDFRWTLFRVGRLTDGPESPVEATYLGSGKDNLSISRASISSWVLDEAVNHRWIGKSPYICNI